MELLTISEFLQRRDHGEVVDNLDLIWYDLKDIPEPHLINWITPALDEETEQMVATIAFKDGGGVVLNYSDEIFLREKDLSYV